MKQVLEGKIKIDADEMPSFMYDVCIPYNANDLQKGLCRGYVLHRVSTFNPRDESFFP